MDPELENLESAFNIEAEKWISEQGLLFQFTHNTSAGSMIPKIRRLFIRLLMLGVIGLGVFWFYLIKLPETNQFKEDLQKQIATGLHAEEVKIKSITRSKGGLISGEMFISSLSLGSTKNSLFEDWLVKKEDISAVGRRSVMEIEKTATFQGVKLSPLRIGDNYFTGWSGKELEIAEMELKLKTGGETDKEAMDAYTSIFKQYETLKIDTIQIYKGNLLWGNNSSSAGSIKESQIKMVRGADSWEMNFTGGTFSQGWLRDAVITKMKVICKRSGEVVIESASFSFGEGELKFNASIIVQAQPELAGNYSFEGVEVTDLIDSSYNEWLGGVIDGTGVFSGKLNSEKGIKYTTTVDLNGRPKLSIGGNGGSKENAKDSVLLIRGNEFELLKFLQIKDPRHSYSVLRAYDGGIIIENQGNDTQFTVTNVRCGIDDHILMRGRFSYSAEAKDSQVDSEQIQDIERSFSGELNLGLVPDVFEENSKMVEVYPIDLATLRVWFNIELKGKLDELTEELTDKLFDIMEESEEN